MRRPLHELREGRAFHYEIETQYQRKEVAFLAQSQSMLLSGEQLHSPSLRFLW